MGILNVTPDSFYDGGAYTSPEDAGLAVWRMTQDGAAVIDIGAESTRPGHTSIDAATELARLMPSLEEALGLNTIVSVDTTKAVVAEKALAAGAHSLNDIWGLQGDPDLVSVAARFSCGLVLMHNRHDIKPDLDIIADIKGFFARSLEIADQAGIERARIVLDPGIGFGKTLEQNLAAMARLDEIRHHFGLPVLLGASRKSFIGKVLQTEDAASPQGRLAGSLSAALCVNADIIRVHDVAETRQALAIRAALRNADRENSLVQIKVLGLAAFAFHGVKEEERISGQNFILDLEAEARVNTGEDDLAQTVSYDSLAQQALFLFQEPCNLIEYAAQRIADGLMNAFPRIARLTVTVHKPHAPVAARFEDICVSVRKTR
jgi:dihydropteroate synthase